MVPSTKQSLSCSVPAGPTQINPLGERVHSSGTHRDGGEFLGSGAGRVLGAKAFKVALFACLCTQALLPTPVFAQMTNIDLATNFTSSRGFSVTGAAAGDESGFSVASAGDINADGYGDVIIGVSYASPSGRINAGSSYVIYGGVSLGSIDLSALTSTQGFSIIGAVAHDFSGHSVASAGDVNKDGYGDVIIGAPSASPSGRSYAGASYVIYGGASLGLIDLSALTSTQGFIVIGAAGAATNPPIGDSSGQSVASAGDMNKDGYGDVIIGAYFASPSGRINAGTSYVIYGGASLGPTDLSALTSTQGFSIIGAAGAATNPPWGDWSGNFVASTGDMNKDGYGDVIIGAYLASPSGRVNAGSSYVIYGGTSLGPIDLNALKSTQGFIVTGAAAGNRSGWPVVSAGDMNADGYGDVIIGAYGASPSGRAYAGTSYVIYGGVSLGSIDLSVLTSTQGFSIIGAAADDESGYSVACAGDMNADGYDDVIIGAYGASPSGRANAGTSYVIYGGASLGSIDLRALTSAQGFIVTGAAAGDNSGISVASARDVNKDGYGDVIIGAYNASPSGRSRAGTSYVIYGGAGGITTTKPTTTSTTSSTSTTSVPTTTTSTSTTQPTTSTTAVPTTSTTTVPTMATSTTRTTPVPMTTTSTPTRSTTSSTNTATVPTTTINSLTEAAPGVFNLSSITPDTGATFINGAGALRNTASIGDMNGDGLPDVAISAPFATINNQTYIGCVYVVYGTTTFSPQIDLSTLNGTNGFIINGINSYDDVGGLASGDVNGDGLSDLVISASQYYGSTIGYVSVVYGSKSLPAQLSLSALNGTNGVIMNGATGYVGYSLSAADFNGDSLTDVIIGTDGANRLYVVYGSPSLPSPVNLSSLGSKGFVISGISNGSLGYSSATTCDINGDELPDILTSGSYGADAGLAYVIFGNHAKLSGFSVTSLNGTNGFTITETGVLPYLSLTNSDINGDGLCDFMTSNPYYGGNTGRVNLIYGSRSFPSSFSVSSLNGTNGVVFNGISPGDGAGWPTSSGDLNGDGYGDILINAFGASPNNISQAGQVYAIYGGPHLPAVFNLTSLNGVNGLTINGPKFHSEVGWPAGITPIKNLTGNGQSALLIGAGGYTSAWLLYPQNIINSLSATTTTQPTTSTTSSTSTTTVSTAMPTTSTTMNAIATIPLAGNTTTISSFNATQQSGAGISSSSSSWTSTIVGVTVGVVAAIGAGYLAYWKWRGHGKVNPQLKAATVAAMNAIDPAREEELRMQTNPVYEGTASQQAAGTYEQPHIDTWARDLYNTQESQASATMYGAPPTIPLRDQAYAALQTLTLDGQGHRATNLNPQGSAWSAAYDTVYGGAKPLAYETILPDQQPWDESTYDLNLPTSGTIGDYIDIVEPSDSRV